MFLLAWALVDIRVAEKWLERPFPTELVHLPTGDLVIPTGPYVGMAALLSVLATAVLIAYVITEERYGEELSTNLVRQPLEQSLACALPYQAVRATSSPG